MPPFLLLHHSCYRCIVNTSIKRWRYIMTKLVEVNVLKHLLYIPDEDGKTIELKCGVQKVPEDVAAGIIDRGYAEPYGNESLPEQVEEPELEQQDDEPELEPEVEPELEIEPEPEQQIEEQGEEESSEPEQEAEPEPEPKPKTTSRRRSKK